MLYEVITFPALVGLLNRDDDVLQGSAIQYQDLVEGGADFSKFYVYYFARDCTGLSNCEEVPKKLLSPGDDLKIVHRITSYNVCYTKLLRAVSRSSGFNMVGYLQ